MIGRAVSTLFAAALILAAASAGASDHGGERGERDDRDGIEGNRPSPERVVFLIRSFKGPEERFRPDRLILIDEADVPTPGIDEEARLIGFILQADQIELSGSSWTRHGLTIPLDQPEEMRSENKIDLSGVLRSVFGNSVKQDTAKSEFLDAPTVGAAFRSKRDLIVVVSPSLPLHEGEPYLRLGDIGTPLRETRPPAARPPFLAPEVIRTTVLADEKHSYWIDSSFTKLTAGKSPALGDAPVLGPLFRIGDVKRKENSLLVFISPKVLSPTGE